METRENAYFDIDDIQMRLACGIDAVAAIQELMETGASTPESYVKALYGVYDYLYIINGRLGVIVDEKIYIRKTSES